MPVDNELNAQLTAEMQYVKWYAAQYQTLGHFPQPAATQIASANTTSYPQSTLVNSASAISPAAPFQYTPLHPFVYTAACQAAVINAGHVIRSHVQQVEKSTVAAPSVNANGNADIPVPASNDGVFVDPSLLDLGTNTQSKSIIQQTRPTASILKRNDSGFIDASDIAVPQSNVDVTVGPPHIDDCNEVGTVYTGRCAFVGTTGKTLKRAIKPLKTVSFAESTPKAAPKVKQQRTVNVNDLRRQVLVNTNGLNGHQFEKQRSVDPPVSFQTSSEISHVSTQKKRKAIDGQHEQSHTKARKLSGPIPSLRLTPPSPERALPVVHSMTPSPPVIQTTAYANAASVSSYYASSEDLPVHNSTGLLRCKSDKVVKSTRNASSKRMAKSPAAVEATAATDYHQSPFYNSPSYPLGDATGVFDATFRFASYPAMSNEEYYSPISNEGFYPSPNDSGVDLSFSPDESPVPTNPVDNILTETKADGDFDTWFANLCAVRGLIPTY